MSLTLAIPGFFLIIASVIFTFFDYSFSLIFLLFHFLKRCWLCSLSIFNLSVFVICAVFEKLNVVELGLEFWSGLDPFIWRVFKYTSFYFLHILYLCLPNFFFSQ
jgi:hypothetical protein